MKNFLLILISGIIMASCGDSLPPGEKAAEGSTGEPLRKDSTVGNYNAGQKEDSAAQKMKDSISNKEKK